MKTILIVDKELRDVFKEVNRRIVFKKNKTIIKDRQYLNDEKFLNNLTESKIPFKFFIEEWELMMPGKVQLVCANNGEPLRPVHIVSNDHFNAETGAKALFQSEKMIIFKIKNNLFELSKNTIDERGDIISNTIKVGEFKSFDDICKQVDITFHRMIKQYETLKPQYTSGDNYLAPFWATV